MFAMWCFYLFSMDTNIISKTYNEKIKFDDLNRFMLEKFPDNPDLYLIGTGFLMKK